MPSLTEKKKKENRKKKIRNVVFHRKNLPLREKAVCKHLRSFAISM